VEGTMEEQEKKKTENISELRQDLVTGDWVVIATSRGKRPDQFKGVPEHPKGTTDPFADPEQSGQEKDVLIYRHEGGRWSTRVFPNKYPAFARGKRQKDLSVGPYTAQTGVGYHEVVVTEDPYKSLAHLETWRVAEVIDAYQERYIALMNKKSVSYVQIFHNHGKAAGASQSHPHSQIMAIPVLDPDVSKSLDGAERYHKKHKKNVFGVMLSFEGEKKERVVFENEHFLLYCPFASRAAFQMNILPKRNNPYFERITNEEKYALAECLQMALLALDQGLGDPAYNFFIRTAPCDGKVYPHYRWHIEILPRTAIWAGFELSSGIEVSTLAPESAALFLRDTLHKSV
jgi:UDPglucose--hexose-1-phosphate uridylyltransferase